MPLLLLDNLLHAADFPQAVDGLAHRFRDRHGLPPVYQLGLVTPEVEPAAGALEDRGIGPFFVAQGTPVLWRERGQERPMRGKMGLAEHQSFELELLEPGEGSDFYRQSLDPEGKTVIQHLGFLVPDVDEWAARLTAAGLPVWVRGKLKMGPVTVDFAYMDTMAEAGLVIEFISWHILGRPFQPPAAFFHSAGRLEKWSGKRSITV